MAGFWLAVNSISIACCGYNKPRAHGKVTSVATAEAASVQRLLAVIESRSVISALLLGTILLLAAAGVPLARRFVYGHFHGANVFVFVETDGKTLLYKNPREVIGLEEDPLTTIPPELTDPNLYETYYNVCWFDSGTLVRCKHSFHHKPQNALYCDQINMEGSFIAKVMEER